MLSFTSLSKALQQLMLSRDIDPQLTWDGESIYGVKDKAEPAPEGHRTILSKSQLEQFSGGARTYCPYFLPWVKVNQSQWFMDAEPLKKL